MVNFYVYAHYTLDTDELFYIGKGCGRRAYHRAKRSDFWKNIERKHGCKVAILIDNLTEADAFVQEILGILEYQPRANFTKGGEGVKTDNPWNKGLKWPERAGKNNPMYGKNAEDFMSIEAIAIKRTKHSIAMKNRVVTQSTRDKLSKANTGKNNAMYGKVPWNKGKKHSEETRAKISQKAKNRKVVRKQILWVDKELTGSAAEIAKTLNSHPQSIRQAARKGITHKGHRFQYV